MLNPFNDLNKQMEITVDTLINLAGLLLGGGCGAFFTWKWQRKKAQAEAKEKEAEAKSAEIDMAQKVQDTYQQMLDDKQKEVEDNHRYIAELKADRDHYRQIVSEMMQWKEKTDNEVRELKMQVARNGRQLEQMRPFQCFDMKCKHRQRVPNADCDLQPETPKPHDIEPINEE